MKLRLNVNSGWADNQTDVMVSINSLAHNSTRCMTCLNPDRLTGWVLTVQDIWHRSQRVKLKNTQYFQYHPKIHKHETVFISSATETRHCCWTLQAFSPREAFLSAVQTQISPATAGVIIIKCLDERLGIKNVSDLNADIHVTSVISWLSHSHRHSVQILSNLMTFPSAVAQWWAGKMTNVLYVA